VTVLQLVVQLLSEFPFPRKLFFTVFPKPSLLTLSFPAMVFQLHDIFLTCYSHFYSSLPLRILLLVSRSKPFLRFSHLVLHPRKVVKSRGERKEPYRSLEPLVTHVFECLLQIVSTRWTNASVCTPPCWLWCTCGTCSAQFPANSNINFAFEWTSHNFVTLSNDGKFVMEDCVYCAWHRKYQVLKLVMFCQSKSRSLFSA
jgi:hypothetical protein